MAEEGNADPREPEETPSGWGRLAQLYERNRRRLQLGALAVFLVAVALEIGGAYPREVRVSLRFPEAPAVREAQIEYRQEEELVRQVRLRFPDGAPRDVRDVVELSPGDYDVAVVLSDDTGASRSLSGTLTAPADGVVRVALE